MYENTKISTGNLEKVKYYIIAKIIKYKYLAVNWLESYTHVYA